MLWDTLTRSRMKDLGQTEPILCPHCKESTKMQLFRTYDNLFLAKIPVLELEFSYFATCPNCARVFSVKSGAGKGFEKEGAGWITTADLTPAPQK